MMDPFMFLMLKWWFLLLGDTGGLTSVQPLRIHVQATVVVWLPGQAFHFKTWSSFNFTQLGYTDLDA